MLETTFFDSTLLGGNEIGGTELNWNQGKKGKPKSNSPSLDRVNNESLINKNNIQIICHSCNFTKRNRTQQEFIEYCTNIAKKFRKI